MAVCSAAPRDAAAISGSTETVWTSDRRASAARIRRQRCSIAESTATLCRYQHFGVILTLDEWKALRDRVHVAGTRVVIEPHIRVENQVGAQATMFLQDPSGTGLEFKAFRDLASLFGK
jgi:extradiol dioxygenase family protein